MNLVAEMTLRIATLEAQIETLRTQFKSERKDFKRQLRRKTEALKEALGTSCGNCPWDRRVREAMK